MNFAFIIASLLANNFISVDATSKFEPQCYSRFDYEYKVVEKLFTLEAAYKKQQEIIQELKDALEEMKNENKALKIEMEGLKNVSIRQEGNIIYLFIYLFILSIKVRKRTFWRVRPAKIQISLCIGAVWSEFSLGAFWIAKDAKFLYMYK